jgi:hypothetical protein
MLLVFTHTRCAGPLACVERSPVGGRVARFGHQARTTAYPCGTSHGPKHLLPSHLDLDYVFGAAWVLQPRYEAAQ